MAMTAVYTNFGGHIVKENRGGTKRGYVPDPLGSTVALVDSAGASTDTWKYWPYGEVESHTGPSTTPFAFVGTLGYFRDLVSKLTYVRARYYQALIGQWMTKDLLWPFEQASKYVEGNPVAGVDYWGLFFQWPWIGGIPKPTETWRDFDSSLERHEYERECRESRRNWCDELHRLYKDSGTACSSPAPGKGLSKCKKGEPPAVLREKMRRWCRCCYLRGLFNAECWANVTPDKLKNLIDERDKACANCFNCGYLLEPGLIGPPNPGPMPDDIPPYAGPPMPQSMIDKIA